MADINPSVFKVVQSYGGLKEAYVESTASAGDILKFTDTQNVKDVKICDIKNADSDHANVTYTIGGTDNNEITIDPAGSLSSISIVATIKYRAY